MLERKKTWLTVTTSVIVFILLLLFWMLDGVDYTPYFLTNYYQATKARLDSLVQETAIQKGSIEIGLGRSSITPQFGSISNDSVTGKFKSIPLAGYGARNSEPAIGIHDSLFAKAVAIRVAGQILVLISLDALIVPVEVATAVADEVHESFGLQRAQILFSATHTHSGVGAWGEGWLAEQFAGKYNAAVRGWLVRQTVQAIEQACADLSPAKFGRGSFAAPQFVKNRLVGKLGWVNDKFDVIVFQKADGDRAVLGVYSAHATVLPAENMQFSGDYPGYWQRAVENEISGMALFFAGSVGSHGPAVADKNFHNAQVLGEALSDSVLALLPQILLQDTLAISALGFPVDLPELHDRLTSGIRLNPIIAKFFLDAENTYLQIFRLGKLLWISTPCDFSGELAIDLKNYARTQGFHAVITSFNGSYIGYLVPGKYYHYNSYESRFMSWFGPNMADYFDELIRRMMVGMMNLQQKQ